jgi:hypothetical protein
MSGQGKKSSGATLKFMIIAVIKKGRQAILARQPFPGCDHGAI